mgnify:CR=1 FL=1
MVLGERAYTLDTELLAFFLLRELTSSDYLVPIVPVAVYGLHTSSCCSAIGMKHVSQRHACLSAPFAEASWKIARLPHRPHVALCVISHGSKVHLSSVCQLPIHLPFQREKNAQFDGAAFAQCGRKPR